jgi:hypothetical protein
MFFRTRPDGVSGIDVSHGTTTPFAARDVRRGT